ncbi:hypothetical protein Pst134EA_031285 [Puccinia striiformis f. sp. tritici]|uniref:uncharacterized protein n=1 Tax=Puccinia striiformis f. sp. tritici TaxID=168172 RepID=UPI002007F39D|nr:uncharacterized protein Pst134EA_031285 [Puccinia striiformis f. sp. tritici]KAH9443409.1 hypothetical protein Pst134EA_031285 [Puccinia striiformis f. sp. tritici]
MSVVPPISSHYRPLTDLPMFSAVHSQTIDRLTGQSVNKLEPRQPFATCPIPERCGPQPCLIQCLPRFKRTPMPGKPPASSGPMGPSPVPHTGGRPTTVSPHVLSPTTVTSHVPTASGFQSAARLGRLWVATTVATSYEFSWPAICISISLYSCSTFEHRQVQSPQGNPQPPVQSQPPRSQLPDAKPAARAKPGPAASASINAQSFVDPPMPAPNPLATMAASPNRNTAASAHPGLVHPAPLDPLISMTPNPHARNVPSSEQLPPQPSSSRPCSRAVTGGNLRRPRGRDKRTQLSPHVMEKIRSQPFDQLRVTVGKDPQCGVLTAADRIETDNIYRTYQIAVYHLAIKNKLHIKPLLEYLGNNTQIRGPTNYNLFCKYHPVAGLIHRNHSLKANDRARARPRRALWDLLSEAEQALWKDQDYLDSLPPLPPLPPVSDTDDDSRRARRQWSLPC